MSTHMTPQEVLDACEGLNIKVRINPDGRLTANPRRRVPDDLMRELKNNKAAIVELLEQLADGEGEIGDPAPAPEPPEPSMAEQILARAAAEGVEITLDEPSQRGRLVANTQMDERINTRRQLPAWLQAAIPTYQKELLAHLRAPYYPPPDPDMQPVVMSIWERMAGRGAPTHQDNQRLINALLTGGPAPNIKAVRQGAALNQALPRVIAPPR